MHPERERERERERDVNVFMCTQHARKRGRREGGRVEENRKQDWMNS